MSWINKLSPDKRLELERMRLDAILALTEKPNEHLEEFVRGLRPVAAGVPAGRQENPGNPLFEKSRMPRTPPAKTSIQGADSLAGRTKRKKTGGRKRHPQRAEMAALAKKRRSEGASTDVIRTEIELLFGRKLHRADIYNLSGSMGRTQKRMVGSHRTRTDPSVLARGNELLGGGMYWRDVAERLREEFKDLGPCDETVRKWVKLLEAVQESSPPDPLSKDGEGDVETPPQPSPSTEREQGGGQPAQTQGLPPDNLEVFGEGSGEGVFTKTSAPAQFTPRPPAPQWVECLLPNVPGRSYASCVERQKEYRLAEYLPITERDEAMKLCKKCPNWLKPEELRAA